MKYRNLMVSLMMITTLFSQNVVGTVSGTNSMPLEGANVVLVGTDLGATTLLAGDTLYGNITAVTMDADSDCSIILYRQ